MQVSCPSCAQPTSVGSRFCSSCGRSLDFSNDATRLSSFSTDSAQDDVTRLSDSRQPGPADETRLSAEHLHEGSSLDAGVLLAGRYRIVRLLGQGGMGTVYEAEDLTLGQTVAIKLLPAALARDPDRLRRFHKEVSLSRQISHPHVCRVYDIAEASGRLFLSMELVRGEDLAALIRRRGALPEAEAVDLARQICAGLGAVHARAILHRDLKPANIMLTDAGEAKIMDFGLAETGLVDGVREGTPAYMAPEQLLGEEVTTRSDIYALGLVIYELLTGRRAFESMTVADLVDVHQSRTDVLMQADLTSLSPRMREVVRRCLERDPARRAASAADVNALLQVVILDERTRSRRLLQLSLAPPIGPFAVAAIASFVRGNIAAAAMWLAAALSFLVLALLYVIKWEATYKGHRIRFEMHTIFGERLFIDGKLVDRGRFGRRITLRGTIESGDGAGERITATSTAGFTVFSCRIVSESFG